MENTQANGYVSEKLFNGVLGDTVPIYHGAPDIDDYANTKRMIFCNVSKALIEDMNSNYVRRYRKWVGAAFQSNPHPSKEQLVAWATEILRKEMTPCVERVIDLDQDDEAYHKMLKEPFLKPGAWYKY